MILPCLKSGNLQALTKMYQYQETDRTHSQLQQGKSLEDIQTGKEASRIAMVTTCIETAITMHKCQELPRDTTSLH